MFLHKSLILATGLLLTVIRAASAATINVPADVPTIQAGLDSSSAGDVVLVASGTYSEHDLMMKSGVEIRSSAGANVTVIDAQNLGKVFLVLNCSGGTVIDGFTMTNGRGIEPYPKGGAIYAENSTFTLSANHIVNSSAALTGGGGYFLNCSPTIQRNVIRNNQGASDGGGIYLHYCSDAVVQSNTVCTNIGGSNGGVTYNVSSGSILDNVICHNQGSHGGGISNDNSSLTIRRNVIFENESGSAGGGIYCGYFGGALLIEENTIVANSTPPGRGGGIFCAVNASPTIQKCIIAFNGEAMGCEYSTSIPTISCSDLFGNVNGNGICGIDGGQNISADPRFCDRALDDYRLHAESPAATAPCGYMGALGVGCAPPVGVESRSWSAVRVLYR
ncbi:MAG: right-handed parallel beta-helix repeat-containing protein [Candidatus Kerfeldbacteria bacterium]|nr:right-handed parallel beta-helix repeat-containing protein [Candidatus Kerfeldbacteria bacterium]